MSVMVSLEKHSSLHDVLIDPIFYFLLLDNQLELDVRTLTNNELDEIIMELKATMPTCSERMAIGCTRSHNIKVGCCLLRSSSYLVSISVIFI